jgi:hypothetical protein
MDRVYMMPLRYDYMYIFCEEFYTEIVNESEVSVAFEKVKRNLSEERRLTDPRFSADKDMQVRDM